MGDKCCSYLKYDPSARLCMRGIAVGSVSSLQFNFDFFRPLALKRIQNFFHESGLLLCLLFLPLQKLVGASSLFILSIIIAFSFFFFFVFVFFSCFLSSKRRNKPAIKMCNNFLLLSPAVRIRVELWSLVVGEDLKMQANRKQVKLDGRKSFWLKLQKDSVSVPASLCFFYRQSSASHLNRQKYSLDLGIDTWRSRGFFRLAFNFDRNCTDVGR